MTENKELRLAYDFVQYTKRHIFLTGKAGTGKTTFLHDLKKNSPKRLVVVAPTGVAAINAGGVTIHSFFQLPFGPILPGRLENPAMIEKDNAFAYRFSKKKINIIKSIDLVIIDEISMVRADVLDGIDRVLKRYRNPRMPFGGVQMLMIGDLQQLPPVVKHDEWDLLRNHYDTMFFFSSQAFLKCNPVTIELKHIYRQQEKHFIEVLNAIRDRNFSPEILNKLNNRCFPDFVPDDSEGYITLTTHNAIADRINRDAMNRLDATEVQYTAEVEGTFPEHAYPAEQTLVLKEGAKVMFIKNDRTFPKRYYNGKTGTVSALDDEALYVRCPGEEEEIAVEREVWENVRYTIHEKTKQIEETVVGTFYQYPLRLAWAITIHKSQGLTFERVVIDAQAAFAHGQVYVALSRCRTLNGLIMTSPIAPEGVIQDTTVQSFNKQVEDQKPDRDLLEDSKRMFWIALMEELFGFKRVDYQLDRIKKMLRDHKSSILGSMPEVVEKMTEQGAASLQNIGVKFLVQIKNLALKEVDFQKGSTIAERLKKAAEYFSEKIESQFLVPLKECTFETDNRQIEKELEERLGKVQELLHVKKACLEYLKNGFDFPGYLNTRAVAMLEDEKKKPGLKKMPEKTTSDHPELLAELKDWRSKKANEQGLPHYRIAATKVLLAISNALPRNNRELKEIKGIGPKKLKQFGDELLSLVALYQHAANAEDPSVH